MSQKSPAFQFYPDKWDTHTRHLSDAAYRIYHRMICWMWLHSQDRCSIPKDEATIAVLLAEPCERIAHALRELQNPAMPLLKTGAEKFISRGLFKEAQKQRHRRKQATKAAKMRWDKDLTPMHEQCMSNANASNEQCLPSPSPSPSPIPSPNKRKRFVAPSASDVGEYGKSIGYDIDGEEFVNFYKSKGWMVGTSPMKDWKACVVTWKKRNKGYAKTSRKSLGYIP